MPATSQQRDLYSFAHPDRVVIFPIRIFEAVLAIRKEGVPVLLVEQNAFMALQIADRGYVMETGEIVLEGTGQALLENDEVQRAYLG